MPWYHFDGQCCFSLACFLKVALETAGVTNNLNQQQNDSLVEYVNAESGDEGVRLSAENRRQAPVIGASKPGICTDNIFYH